MSLKSDLFLAEPPNENVVWLTPDRSLVTPWAEDLGRPGLLTHGDWKLMDVPLFKPLHVWSFIKLIQGTRHTKS